MDRNMLEDVERLRAWVRAVADPAVFPASRGALRIIDRLAREAERAKGTRRHPADSDNYTQGDLFGGRK